MKQRESDGHVLGHTPDYEYAATQIIGWILGHPNSPFSATSLAKELETSPYYVDSVAKVACTKGLVAKRNIGYVSQAPPLEPTAEGVIEETQQLIAIQDDLGRQARAEFYTREHLDFRYRRGKYITSGRY